MEIQELIGQWVGKDAVCAPKSGIEIHAEEIIFHPPKTNVSFDIASQHWPAHYNLDDNTLTVTFTGHSDSVQTMTFQVIAANEIRDNNGYNYKKCVPTPTS